MNVRVQNNAIHYRAGYRDSEGHLPYQPDVSRCVSKGGAMLQRLEKRVEHLETDVGEIKLNLACLTTRSEEFSTKTDMAKLVARCDEFATKTDLAKLVARCDEFATKTDLAKLTARCDEFATKSDLHREVSSLHREISGQTKWITATILGVAALCMTSAKLFF